MPHCKGPDLMLIIPLYEGKGMKFGRLHRREFITVIGGTQHGRSRSARNSLRYWRSGFSGPRGKTTGPTANSAPSFI
jgi:hypothetical protein